VIIAATILLSVAVAWALLAPHFCTTPVGSLESRDEGVLIDQKSRCVQVLRDLELDHSTQKISTEDYMRTKNELEVELAGIITTLEKSNR